MSAAIYAYADGIQILHNRLQPTSYQDTNGQIQTSIQATPIDSNPFRYKERTHWYLNHLDYISNSDNTLSRWFNGLSNKFACIHNHKYATQIILTLTRNLRTHSKPTLPSRHSPFFQQNTHNQPTDSQHMLLAGSLLNQPAKQQFPLEVRSFGYLSKKKKKKGIGIGTGQTSS